MEDIERLRAENLRLRRALAALLDAARHLTDEGDPEIGTYQSDALAQAVVDADAALGEDGE